VQDRQQVATIWLRPARDERGETINRVCDTWPHTLYFPRRVLKA
jgi:hypothetical protein